MELKARRVGDAILCGYGNCRGLLGRIECVQTMARVRVAADRWTQVPSGYEMEFSLPDIFVHRGNGFYEEPAQRAKRRRSGYSSTHKTTRLMRASADAPPRDQPKALFQAGQLPIRVRCPRRGCGWVSLIVAELLDPQARSALD